VDGTAAHNPLWDGGESFSAERPPHHAHAHAPYTLAMAAFKEGAAGTHGAHGPSPLSSSPIGAGGWLLQGLGFKV
jgi:hypothetical protein